MILHLPEDEFRFGATMSLAVDPGGPVPEQPGLVRPPAVRLRIFFADGASAVMRLDPLEAAGLATFLARSAQQVAALLESELL